MTTVNKVVVTTTFTRPDTNFPWHEDQVLDPDLAMLQQEVVAYQWANYVGLKAVERKKIGDLTFIIKFTWYKEETYNEWAAFPNVQQYLPALKAYYEANGGTMTQDVQISVNEFLSS